MKKVLLILVSILLVGCSTSYQPEGFTGGYSEFALSHDAYRVSFRGNGYTSRKTVQTNLLRRCAELTLQKRYEYFIILDSRTNTDQSHYKTQTTVNAQHSTYGNTTYSTATVNPGQTYTYNKHTGTVMIKMLKTDQGYPSAFNAKVILSNFHE